MPRPKPDFQAVPVMLRMHPDAVAMLDNQRGEHTRVRWIEELIADRDDRDHGAKVKPDPKPTKPPFSHGRSATTVVAKRRRVQTEVKPKRTLVGFTTTGEEIWK